MSEHCRCPLCGYAYARYDKLQSLYKCRCGAAFERPRTYGADT